MARLAAQVAALVGIAVVLGLASNALRSEGIDWGDPEHYRYPDVEYVRVDEAAPLHPQATTLFLDARSGAEFAAGHVFGAVSLPAEAVGATYEELRPFLASTLDLVVYADEDDAMSAVHVARFLNERGYRARVLDGGWQAWQEKRFPVE